MTNKEEMQKPFNLLSLALAVLGIGLAMYFYFVPHSYRKIAVIATDPALIFDSKAASPSIHLTDSTGTAITSDTYSLGIKVWNSGTETIEPAEIRRPLIIIIPEANRLLDSKFVAATDMDVAGFTLAERKDITNRVEIEVKWNHFDPNKGFNIQLLVASANKPTVQLAGDFIGFKGFQKPSKTWQPFEKWRLTIGWGMLGFLFAIFGLLMVSINLPREIKEWASHKRDKKIAIIVAVLGLLSISIMGIILVFVAIGLASTPIPPF